MRIYLSLKRMKALYQITDTDDLTVGVCVINMGSAGGVAGETNSIRSSPSRKFSRLSKLLESKDFVPGGFFGQWEYGEGVNAVHPICRGALMGACAAYG